MNRDASQIAPPDSCEVVTEYNMAVGYSTVTFLSELNNLVINGWAITGGLQVSTAQVDQCVNKLFAQLVYRTVLK